MWPLEVIEAEVGGIKVSISHVKISLDYVRNRFRKKASGIIHKLLLTKEI